MNIEHVALYVEDLEAAKRFFTTYLNGRANAGYHNPRTGLRSYFVSFDDGARLELMNWPDLGVGGAAGHRAGYGHIAFSVGSREAVDALTARLERDGWPLLSGPRVTGEGYYESCLAIVEGNQIEITI